MKSRDEAQLLDCAPRAYYGALKNEGEQLSSDALLRGEETLERSWVEWAYGSPEPGMAFLAGSLLVIHESVGAVLRDEEFVGWRSVPIPVFSKAAKPCFGYEAVMITGRCGPLRKEKSRVVRERVPAGFMRDVVRGLVFDIEEWDGSDFFLFTSGERFILTTPRVQEVFGVEGIRGVAFESVGDIIVSSSPEIWFRGSGGGAS